ncbi:MAG TPA: hypothetical protein VFW70_01565 [Methylomirabilota bacterium]|nr:hypothetical protein [Methylomirabilota bacterium]
MSRRAATVACLGLAGALLTGCASTTAPPRIVTDGSRTQLCALDALLWSYGFVPRATDQTCVTILETLKIREE